MLVGSPDRSCNFKHPTRPVEHFSRRRGADPDPVEAAADQARMS
jgi:hypothetical protein